MLEYAKEIRDPVHVTYGVFYSMFRVIEQHTSTGC